MSGYFFSFFQEYYILISRINKENLTKENQVEILNRIFKSFDQLHKTMERYIYKFEFDSSFHSIYIELQEIYDFSEEIAHAIPQLSCDAAIKNRKPKYFTNIISLYEYKYREYKQIYNKILQIQSDCTREIYEIYTMDL